MSAELVASAPALSYLELAGELPGTLEGDSYRLIYCVAGACSECGMTGVETYLGCCEECADFASDERSDLLQPATFSESDGCQADGCGGTVQYVEGLGRCDTCGIDHRAISAENYARLFARYDSDTAGLCDLDRLLIEEQ